ncbi:hypothetical protein EB232_15130 [Mesorhizobium sp. NZP2077]|nr:hypothetical protein EB232_15130 [Mesorhizobium sp. NZP2077]
MPMLWHRRQGRAFQERPPDVGDEIEDPGISAHRIVSRAASIKKPREFADGLSELIDIARREKNPIVFV